MKRLMLFCALALSVWLPGLLANQEAGTPPTPQQRQESLLKQLHPLLELLTTSQESSGMVIALRDKLGDIHSYVLKMNAGRMYIKGPLNFIPLLNNDDMAYLYRFTESERKCWTGAEARKRNVFLHADTICESTTNTHIFITNDISDAHLRGNQVELADNALSKVTSSWNEANAYDDADYKVSLESISAGMLTIRSRETMYHSGANQEGRTVREYSFPLDAVLQAKTVLSYDLHQNSADIAAAVLRPEEFVNKRGFQKREKIIARLSKQMQAGIANGRLPYYERCAVAFNTQLMPEAGRLEVLACTEMCIAQVEEVVISACRVDRCMGKSFVFAQAHCDGPYFCSGGVPFIYETVMGELIGSERQAATIFPAAALLGAGVIDYAVSPLQDFAVFITPDLIVALNIAGQVLWSRPIAEYGWPKERVIMAEPLQAAALEKLLSSLAKID